MADAAPLQQAVNPASAFAGAASLTAEALGALVDAALEPIGYGMLVVDDRHRPVWATPWILEWLDPPGAEGIQPLPCNNGTGAGAAEICRMCEYRAGMETRRRGPFFFKRHHRGNGIDHAIAFQGFCHPIGPDPERPRFYVHRYRHLGHESDEHEEAILREGLLRTTMQHSVDAIILFDSAFQVRHWSRGAEQLYGYTAAEAMGQPLDFLLTEEDRRSGLLKPLIEQLQREGAVRLPSTVRRARNGRLIGVSIAWIALPPMGGQPGGFVAFHRDLTAHREMESRLLRSAEQLDKLAEIDRLYHATSDLDQLLEAVLVAVTAGDGLKFNRAFLFLVDEEARQLCGVRAVGPADAVEADRIYRSVAERHLSLQETIREHRRSGRESDSVVNRLVQDIRVPLDHPTDTLVRVLKQEDPFRFRRDIEPQGLSGVLAERFTGSDFVVAPLAWKDERIGLLLVDNLMTGRPIGDEDVDFLMSFVNRAAIAIKNSRLIAGLATKVRQLEETTETLRRVQDEKVHYEKLAALGEMSARVAHEIRNPLVSIGGFARSLLKSTPKDHPTHRQLEVIVEETLNLERILKDLTDFVNPRKNPHHPADLNRTLERSLLIMQVELENGGMEVSTELDPNLPPVPVDEPKLVQALINLYKNALQALEGRPGRLTVRSRREGPWACLEVSDDGSGISPENLPRLFTPFFTTKSTGLGLGLPVIERVVQQHGGRIEVNSRLGRGTTFVLRLPIGDPVGEAKEREAVP